MNRYFILPLIILAVGGTILSAMLIKGCTAEPSHKETKQVESFSAGKIQTVRGVPAAYGRNFTEITTESYYITISGVFNWFPIGEDVTIVKYSDEKSFMKIRGKEFKTGL